MKEMLAALALALTVGTSVIGANTTDINNSDSTVGIVTIFATGSGVIFSDTTDHALILTAAHVVEHHTKTDKVMVMYNEHTTALGTIIYISDTADMAFISVDKNSIPEAFHCANVDEKAYDDLAVGDSVIYNAKIPFHRNVNPNQTRLLLDDLFKVHTIKDKWYYDDFCADYVICGHGSTLKHDTCNVMAGMSGGGAYDSEGNLVGMLIACDENDVMSYSIPLPTILKEYKIAQKILEESEEKVNYED